MATQIINLADYRQARARRHSQAKEFAPSPDRLWEFLARNVKIKPDDYGVSPRGNSA